MTRDRIYRLTKALKLGSYREAACRAAGIELQTFYNWMTRGRRPGEVGRYREFFETIEKVEAEVELGALKHWKGAMPKNWQAARDFLERRFPARWSQRVQVTLTKELGNALDQLENEFKDEPAVLERALNAIAGGHGGEALGGEEVGEGGPDHPGGETVLPAPPEPEAGDGPPA